MSSPPNQANSRVSSKKIPSDFINRLKNSADIVALIEAQSGQTLKKCGDHLEMRCCLHEEKTPSFKVYPQDQRYRCFGCGASGDALQFLVDHLKIDFPDAVRELASFNGMQMPETVSSELNSVSHSTLRNIFRDATQFYVDNFNQDGDGLEYMYETRGFDDLGFLKKQQIGATTKDRSLFSHLKDKYSISDLEASTLIVRNDRGDHYDFFGSHLGKRVIIPIRDRSGRTIAFTSRVFLEADEQRVKSGELGKYINTKEIPFFSKKSQLLDGIDLLPKNGDVIVVEGNIDRLTAAYYGYPAVALGTSQISDEQIVTLLRHTGYGMTGRIILCLDGDKPGEIGSFKSVVTAFSQRGGALWVASIPHNEGEKVDVDDVLRKQGKVVFDEILKNAVSATEFFRRSVVNQALQHGNATDPQFVNTIKQFAEKQLNEVDSDFKQDILNYVVLQHETTLPAAQPVRKAEPFWYEVQGSDDDDPVLLINTVSFLEFLQTEGFYTYWLTDSYEQKTSIIFVRIVNKLVQEVTIDHIRDHVAAFVDSLEGNITKSFTKTHLLALLIKKTNPLFTESRLKWLKSVSLDFHRDDEKNSFFYYKNCFIQVNDKGYVAKPYTSLTGVIWARQVIQRDFKILPSQEVFLGVFAQFQRNICRKRDEPFDAAGEHSKKLQSLQSAIGYVLHRYRTSTRIAAVIFNDEQISDEPKGRSGKGLTCAAISKIRTLVSIDGKKFDPNYNHNFQNVRRDTNIVLFDDLAKKFDLESLFAIMSNGLTINIKGQPIPVEIPFADSPKFIMTTNYVVSGDSDSHAGRKWELTASPYYNVSFTPEDDFKMRLFEDFDRTEWLRFDNYMMECVKTYFQIGMFKYVSGNLSIRKLIQATNQDFIDFADEEIVHGKEYDKQELLSQFKRQNPDYEKTFMRTFTRWLTEYAKYRQLKFTERASHGKKLITLS